MEKKLKFYKYFFEGNYKPLIMEAYSKDQANTMMNDLAYRSQGKINLDAIIDERTELPLVGVSTKKIKGVEYVWVGKNVTRNGWMSRKEYKAL